MRPRRSESLEAFLMTLAVSGALWLLLYLHLSGRL